MKYRKLVRENGMNGSKEMRWYVVGNTEVQIRFCCFLFLSFLFGGRKNMFLRKQDTRVRKRETDYVGERKELVEVVSLCR